MTALMVAGNGAAALVELIFAEGQNFDCGSCTKCCRGAWTIHVDPHSYRKVVGSPLYDELAAKNEHAPMYLEEPDNEISARTQMRDGVCVFLGQDNLCGIHKAMGATAKPLGCTQFPFILRPAPDGVYVGVSFYCSAVQANSGRPLAEHVGDMQRLLDVHHFPTIGYALKLDDAHTITWDTYKRIEAGMSVDEPWLSAMRVMLMASAMRRGLSADEAVARASVARIERDEVFQSLEKMFLNGVIGAIESKDPSACKANTEAFFKRGQVDSENFGTLDLTGFDAFRARFDASWSHDHFRRYLQHLLFRKHLAYKRTVAANAAAWYMAWPLLEFYRDLSAFSAGRTAPEPRDVHRAFDVVERCFATHAQFMDTFFTELARGFGRMLDMEPL